MKKNLLYFMYIIVVVVKGMKTRKIPDCAEAHKLSKSQYFKNNSNSKQIKTNLIFY